MHGEVYCVLDWILKASKSLNVSPASWRSRKAGVVLNTSVWELGQKTRESGRADMGKDWVYVLESKTLRI